MLESAAGQATEIAAALANEEEELKGWALTLQAQLRGAFGGIAFPRAVAGFANPKSGAARESDSSPEQAGSCLAQLRKLEEKLAQLDQAPTLRDSQFEQSLCPLIEAALQDLAANQPQPGRRTKISRRTRALPA